MDMNVNIYKIIFVHTYIISDLSHYKPLYAPKDFLDVLFAVRDPSFKKQKYGKYLRLFNILLHFLLMIYFETF